MPITCERCGSDEISLVKDLPDGRKRVRCDRCGHEWDRGKATVPETPATSSTAPDEPVVSFIDDDEGYETWFRRNRIGYVLNCYRNPNADYLVLHTADCYTITVPGPQATTWTGDYIKICSRKKAALEQWAEDELGARPSLCGVCFG